MKINYPILRKALGFAFLPTLLVIVVAMFATLSFTSVFEFLLSDSGWAIVLRIILLIVEVGLVWGLYEHYSKREEIKKVIDEIDDDSLYRKIGKEKEVYELFNDSFSSNPFTYKARKISSNIIILKKF